MFRSNFRFKKEKVKHNFCIYNPHTEKGFKPVDKKFLKKIGRHSDDYIGITSIDPGTVNIGLHINFFWNNGYSKSHELNVLDFSTEDRKDEDIDEVKYYNEAILAFDKYLEYFEQTHYILIESQLSLNPQAMRMSQHFISYFMIKMKDRGVQPLIIEISPELKTLYLGGPVGRIKGETKDKAKRKRKEWCRQKAEDILTIFHDEMVEKVIKKRAKRGEGKSKRDDMGDVVCQTYVWLLLCSKMEWWDGFMLNKFDLEGMLVTESISS